jgi:hypothetical protein
LLSSIYMAVSGIAAFLTARAVASWLDRGNGPVPVAAADLMRCMRQRRLAAIECWLGTTRFVLLFGAAVVALLLAFDPRYRDFPLSLYAAPAVGFGLLGYVTRSSGASTEERLLAAVLASSVPIVLIREGLHNIDALAWAALSLVFAASVLLSSRGDASRQHEPSQQESHRTGRGGIEQQGSETKT